LPGIWLGAFLANNWSVLHHPNARPAFVFLVSGVGMIPDRSCKALLGADTISQVPRDLNPFDRFKQSLTFVGCAFDVPGRLHDRVAASTWEALCLGMPRS